MAVDVYRPLHQIEVAFNCRDQIDPRRPGNQVRDGPRASRPEAGGLSRSIARAARRCSVLHGDMHLHNARIKICNRRPVGCRPLMAAVSPCFAFRLTIPSDYMLLLSTLAGSAPATRRASHQTHLRIHTGAAISCWPEEAG